MGSVPTLQRLPLLLGLLMAAVACGSKGGTGEAVGQDVEQSSSCARFVLFDSEDWELREAVDYPDDLGRLGELDPGIDWYSEFERFVPLKDGTGTQGLYLRLTGYSVALAEILEKPGLPVLAEHDEEGRQIYQGRSPDGSLSVVAWPIGSAYTIVLFGQGLAVDELAAAATETRPVCQDDWVESGGVVLDCMPTEPGCGLPAD